KIHAMRQSMTSLGHRLKCQPHECSIESCLYQFTTMEMLTGNNKYLCSHCNKGLGKKAKYTIANRQALIFVPPSILTLHLKRFQQTIMSLKKLSKHVTFSEILDMAPFCSSLAQNVKPNEDKVLYSLFGVVEHSGSLRSGHYTAYVKVRDDIKDTASSIPLQPNGIGNKSVVGSENSSVGPYPGRWFYVSDGNVSEVKNISNVLNSQAYILFYERIL
ncbi:hypothetical protein HELRODRAFT_77618, partial [Helobdella robusta]|uniref:USP domain-containing protein n=1 Tax=Helobdella robusta TaxID=6412 RepID=T1G308_HELRO